MDHSKFCGLFNTSANELGQRIRVGAYVRYYNSLAGTGLFSPARLQECKAHRLFPSTAEDKKSVTLPPRVLHAFVVFIRHRDKFAFTSWRTQVELFQADVQREKEHITYNGVWFRV
jgi:hypothetical protein